MSAPRRSVAVRWAAALALAALLAGCGSTDFDPIAATERVYSVYGYLDAGADTQAVRVTPLRGSVVGGSLEIDARVTLERVDTGATTVWAHEAAPLRDGRVAHVFRSAERVAPGQTYRLRVARSDGASSEALVRLPPCVPEVTVVGPSYALSVRVAGAERLADVVLRIERDRPGEAVRASLLDRALPAPEGGFALAFSRDFEVQRVLCGVDASCPSARSVRLLVAATNEDWPDFAGLDAEELAAPGLRTNVERGVGFVGGIASRTVDL